MRWIRMIGNWLWPWRWMGVGVVGAWVFVMFRLASGPSHAGTKDIEELYPWAVQKPLSIGNEWAGIYMVGKKIGYSHTRTEKQKDGFRISNRSLMKMQLFGSFQKVTVISRVQTDKKYRLRQFVFKLLSPLSTFQVHGKVVGAHLRVRWRVGERNIRTRLPYRPSMLSSVLRPYIAAQKPPPGKKLKAVLFDPQSRSYINTVITVEKYVQIRIKKKLVRALRLRQQYRGMTLLAWIDQDGKILKEQAPGGMVLLRESAQEAPKGIEEGFDLIRATRIGLVGRISSPTTRKKLRLRIEKVTFKSFPVLRLGRQSLAIATRELTVRKEEPASWPKQPFSLAVALQKPLLPKSTSQPSPRSTSRSTKSFLRSPTRKRRSLRKKRHDMVLEYRRKEALKETPLIQSKHPNIRKQASKILVTSSDRLGAIRAISRWVHGALRKQSVVGIPSALDTLKKRVGDCNEHATLLAALARSVSIPCDIVTGVAYQRGHFYFHAWNECEASPGHWLSLDATWNQFPSDVTHIVFARGGLKKQLALLQLLGQLRIKVLN